MSFNKLGRKPLHLTPKVLRQSRNTPLRRGVEVLQGIGGTTVVRWKARCPVTEAAGR